jgi:hypothetical protein
MNNRFTIYALLGQSLSKGGPIQIIGGYTSKEAADESLKGYNTIAASGYHYMVAPILVLDTRPGVQRHG